MADESARVVDERLATIERAVTETRKNLKDFKHGADMERNMRYIKAFNDIGIAVGVYKGKLIACLHPNHSR
jgi:hypothetical protein